VKRCLAAQWLLCLEMVAGLMAATGLPAVAAAAPPEGVSVPWPALSGPASYTFVSNRLNFPLAVRSDMTTALGDIVNYSPPYPTAGIRFLYANFYVSSDGRPKPEGRPGNPNTIDFATVLIDGKVFPVTFGGASQVVLADGAFAWSDPLKDSSGNLVSLGPNSSYVIRTSRSAPPGGNLVIGSGNAGVQPRFTHALGDGVEFGNNVQVDKRLKGSVRAYAGGSTPVGPAMAIGTGWDGSAVYLLLGDSIGVGQGDTDFGRGIVGYLARGLDDDSRSKRRNFATMMISGTKPDDQSSDMPGEYELRMAALRSIPNRPFNVIISEMGQNSPSIASLSVEPFEEVEKAWWAYWHVACPSCRIFQTTFPTHARALDNSGWTQLTAQKSDYPSGARWLASEWFRHGPLPSYVTSLDVTRAFCDDTHPGFWKVSNWSGSTAMPLTRGDLQVTVAGTVAPSVGDTIVIDPGAPQVDLKNIWSVSGTGPWTVSVTAAFATDHAVGSRVGLAYTADGTHPNATLYKAAANIIETYKSSGVLP